LKYPSTGSTYLSFLVFLSCLSANLNFERLLIGWNSTEHERIKRSIIFKTLYLKSTSSLNKIARVEIVVAISLFYLYVYFVFVSQSTGCLTVKFAGL